MKDLLVASNFIRAVRESGYLSLSTALAELIDNSIQAGATEVEIAVSRDETRGAPRIAVEDNGEGMTADELGECLRFGGSSRFDNRDSFGRFGMGLPAASLSQTRWVEVTTWRHGENAMSVSLDVDSIVGGLPPGLSLREGTAGNSPSGCRVTWHDCDRIEYHRLGWLERVLFRDLGRMYRRFLNGRLTITINGTKVDAVDPLLLTTDIDGEAASLIFEPIRYEIGTTSGDTATVSVRFTMLPVHRWHSLDNGSKRRIGIVGQGSVSILRAGREIANGWYFMGSKRKENYDDWWRCEIEFDPALDEHFGITVNKQGVRPSSVLREAIEPELESIARLLNTRVRLAFEEVKFEAAVQGSCRIAGDADPDLPVLRTSGASTGALSYHLGSAQLSGDSMFDVTLEQRKLDVTMNIDHPAFAALYRPLQELGESGTPVRTAFELLLLSFGRSIAIAGIENQDRQDLLQLWGVTYGRMLKKS